MLQAVLSAASLNGILIVVATVGWGALARLGAAEASTLPHDVSYASIGH